MVTVLRASTEAGALVGQDTANREGIATQEDTRKTGSLVWEELWRQVYTPLLDRPDHNGSQVFAISSPLDGEGKTTVALGLALAMAKDLERSILLLDCNLLRPSLSESLGIRDVLGLTNCLAGKMSVDAVMRRTGLGNLSIVPSGPEVANSSKLIRSSSMAEVMQDVRKKYDIIVMDMPSMLSSSDARVLASYSDSVLLVVRVGMSTTGTVEKALGLLEGPADRAIVINDFQSSLPKFLQRAMSIT